jgi:hypothetical protein
MGDTGAQLNASENAIERILGMTKFEHCARQAISCLFVTLQIEFSL